MTNKVLDSEELEAAAIEDSTHSEFPERSSKDRLDEERIEVALYDVAGRTLELKLVRFLNYKCKHTGSLKRLLDVFPSD